MSTPTLVATIVAIGAVTFVSRAVFLVRTPHELTGVPKRFLDRFPIALFVALAVVQAFAPEGELLFGPEGLGLIAGACAAVFSRSLPIIMAVGWVVAFVAAQFWN